MPYDRQFLARHAFYVAFWYLMFAPPIHAEGLPADAERIEHRTIHGATVYRHKRVLIIEPNELTQSGSVTIPRICGSLRAMRWSNGSRGSSLKLHPEPQHWIVRWSKVPTGEKTIVVEFDQEPLLVSELDPAVASGDGSLMLHAYQGITAGEKLRYEPQTFKNTVGYWTVSSDTVTWRMRVEQPGDFNIAILQGCGAGQGGSQASISLNKEGQEISQVEVEVLETGHFQNFQWRHIGQLTVAEPGIYSLKIAPTHIRKTAVMDIRAVHLIRQPKVSNK